MTILTLGTISHCVLSRDLNRNQNRTGVLVHSGVA